MRGFPFLTRRACAESNARSDPSPTEIIHPTKESAGSGWEPRLALLPRKSAAGINIQHQYKGWLCAVGFRSDPDHGSGLNACPSEIGGPGLNVCASRDFVA
jgi:hypothetical protein